MRVNGWEFKRTGRSSSRKETDKKSEPVRTVRKRLFVSGFKVSELSTRCEGCSDYRPTFHTRRKSEEFSWVEKKKGVISPKPEIKVRVLPCVRLSEDGRTS